MSAVDFLLVDISNSFTKIARSAGDGIQLLERVPTRELSVGGLERWVEGGAACRALVFCSVVPVASEMVRSVSGVEHLELTVDVDLGLEVEYPNPREIGPDRLANALACGALHGCPAIVVDFGTAVTFDVISGEGNYLGGVIAPGLNAMTGYLHERTALLPKISVLDPGPVLGKSTVAAMQSGAIHGYRGLVKEILARLIEEVFPGETQVRKIATGGDAQVIDTGLGIFDEVDPLLTLRGLRILGERIFREGTGSSH